MKNVYKCSTIFSYQRHMSRWQGAHAPSPPFWQNFKKLDFLYRSMHSNDIFLISFIYFIFFADQFLSMATLSGPPSKIVPHFLVNSYSSANSMHV